MTFKIKSGLQVGSTTVVDQNSYYQQTESLSTVSPSLVLDFTTKTLDKRISFARASAATVVGPNKLVQYVTSGTPRFDHDPITGECKGLLIESLRTNYLSDSNHVGIYSASSAVEYFGYPAPDGSYTAARIKAVETTSTTKYIYRFENTQTGNGNYVASVYVKYVSEPIVYFRLNDQTGGNGSLQQFNIQTGTAVGSTVSHGATNAYAAIHPAGGGWYRISIAGTFSSSPTQIHATLFFAVYGPTTVTTAFDVWGMQIETGLTVSTFIPSTDTFSSRASTATYFDSTDGLLKSAAINTSRPNFNPITRVNNGVLIETAVSNYLYQTESVTGNNAYCTVTSDAITAPDGTTTADKLVEGSGNPGFTRQTFRGANNSLFATVGNYTTFSVFAKAGERYKFQLDISDAVYTPADNAVFDLLAGTVTYGGVYSANIIPYPNGWYRCSLTAKVVTNTSGGMFINMLDNSGNTIYSGDGTSGLYFWGFQAEIGQGPTSYIPATSTTYNSRSADVWTSTGATRANDSAYIRGVDIANWINSTEGSLFVDWYEGTFDGTYGIASLNANTGNERVDVRRQAGGSSGYLAQYVSTGGLSSVYSSIMKPYAYNQRLKAATVYKKDDFILGLTGPVTLAADTNGPLPYFTQLQIGGIDAHEGFQSFSWMRSVVYYPKRLANTTIQAILSQEN